MPGSARSHGLAFAAVGLFGLMAGFFYAFSVCVMPGLDDAGAGVAVPAMQGINRLVRNPVFFATFFLSPVVAAVAALAAWRVERRRAAALLAAAAIVYVAGVVVATALVNVPMNEALAEASAGLTAARAERLWQAYHPVWTTWNTARTIAALVATLLATLAVSAGPGTAAPRPPHD